MKRSDTITVIFFLLGFLPIVHAQESELPGNDTLSSSKQTVPVSPQEITRVLKTNPFTTIWGPIPFTSEYRITYEFVNSRNQSSQVGFSFLGKSPILTMIEDSLFPVAIMVRGYRFQASHRFYLTRFLEEIAGSEYYAPRGIFIAPHISYSTARFTPKLLNLYDMYFRISHFNVNLLGGVQIFLDNISFEVFMGLGYKNNTWVFRHSPTQVEDLPLEGNRYYRGPVKINLGFNIGVGF